MVRFFKLLIWFCQNKEQQTKLRWEFGGKYEKIPNIQNQQELNTYNMQTIPKG